MRGPNAFLPDNFNINLCLELPHIDEICEGKVHVLEEFVELAYQMQILCQFLVKTFIPVWRWAIHANERIEGCKDTRKVRRIGAHLIKTSLLFPFLISLIFI